MVIDIHTVRDLRRRIEGLQERIARIRSSLEGSTIRIRDLPGGASKEQDRMASDVARLLELEDQLKARVLEYETELIVIDEALAALPSPEQEVMRLRYVDGLKWWEVAQRMNYDERWCKRLAKRAEDSLLD
ncbi:sigma factor-like helix-turn-helix DNA-binding protein [Gehongia tenuis]|uniref:Sigma-70 family RNA polymerase sigma factor n=1 Tax=Gehongia tenuis TaxID=2763655 RepID=A0A926D5L4_9FIRM|nr:sigma factor-like helix-turn-helix DNA-binding protein [Gehongia tenuis]MBC8531793.1 sigma-70 family RNA polymerase sigma factor [Gehongia tenuis]